MPDTANQKISELPSVSSAAASDVLAGVKSNTTSKFPLSVLKTFFQSGLTKSSVGLGNVDNTSDANKPVSTAQQAAIDAAADALDESKQDAIDSGSITLSLSWSGSGPYTQVVTVTGATVTANSMISFQPTAAQLTQLMTDGVTALTIENNNGTLTAYALGAAPSTAMTIACTVTEVET